MKNDYGDYDDDYDDEEELNDSELGCVEVREEVDANGKVVSTEILDLSKQLDQFQSMVSKSKANDTEKAEKQQELVDKLKACVSMERKVALSQLDSDSKFMMEIAALSVKSNKQLRKKGNPVVSPDLDFLDELMGKELDAAEVIAAEKYRKAEIDLKSKSTGSSAISGWKKGFFSKSDKSAKSPKTAPSSGSSSISNCSTNGDTTSKILESSKEDISHDDPERPYTDSVIERSEVDKVGGTADKDVQASVPVVASRPLSIFAQQRLKMKERTNV